MDAPLSHQLSTSNLVAACLPPPHVLAWLRPAPPRVECSAGPAPQPVTSTSDPPPRMRQQRWCGGCISPAGSFLSSLCPMLGPFVSTVTYNVGAKIAAFPSEQRNTRKPKSRDRIVERRKHKGTVNTCAGNPRLLSHAHPWVQTAKTGTQTEVK